MIYRETKTRIEYAINAVDYCDDWLRLPAVFTCRVLTVSSKCAAPGLTVASSVVNELPLLACNQTQNNMNVAWNMRRAKEMIYDRVNILDHGSE